MCDKLCTISFVLNRKVVKKGWSLQAPFANFDQQTKSHEKTDALTISFLIIGIYANVHELTPQLVFWNECS